MRKFSVCLMLILIFTLACSSVVLAEKLDEDIKAQLREAGKIIDSSASSLPMDKEAGKIKDSSVSLLTRDEVNQINSDMRQYKVQNNLSSSNSTTNPTTTASTVQLNGDGVLAGLNIGFGGGQIDDKLSNKTAKLLGALQVAGYITAAIILIYIGIKYILASGDEKADLKTAIPKYCLGAGLIVLCDLIVSFIFKLF